MPMRSGRNCTFGPPSLDIAEEGARHDMRLDQARAFAIEALANANRLYGAALLNGS